MHRSIFLLFIVFSAITHVNAQSSSQDLDSLKAEILNLKSEVHEIQLNLATSENKFKRGIFVATLGYSTVIAGGLMLGRKRDDLGKGLLVTGGAFGVAGTIMLVDSFKYLGRPFRKRARS